ncbi:MAG TPA: DHA2 family efflux MFS transporter permease subunit [Terriglobales bacterium]
MSSTAVLSNRSTRSHETVNPWIIAIAVMLGTFMEVLDTTVVNVALPHIAGSLSSTEDEATWVLTSYLVSNAIILPMTGWLANHFGRKRILLMSVIGFTISSLACGLAPTLGTLIIFRIIQGATGGGLQPLSQAIMMEAFPPEKRGKAMAFWALGIVVAPMLGPVLGGWLTDSYSWRWVFYINLPIGILATVMAILFIFDPPYIKPSGEGVDYWGMGFLVVGMGALQILLDKGQQEDWFSSDFIRLACTLAVVGLTAFVVRELMTEHPIVDLRALKNRSYATGVFMMTVIGFALYGSTVLLPLWLQTLMGYPALQSGLALLPRGMGSFLFMPIVGIMTGIFDPRKLLASGLIVVGVSFYVLSNLNLQSGYWDIFWAQILQGAAMGLLFVPLSTVTMDSIAKEKMGNASSIFNLMRNIGASIGIASVGTIYARGTQSNTAILGVNVNPYSSYAQQMVQGLSSAMHAAGSDAFTAVQRSYAALFMMVQQQAAMLAFIKTFRILCFLFFAMLPLLLIMRRPKHMDKNGGGAGVH